MDLLQRYCEWILIIIATIMFRNLRRLGYMFSNKGLHNLQKHRKQPAEAKSKTLDKPEPSEVNEGLTHEQAKQRLRHISLLTAQLLPAAYYLLNCAIMPSHSALYATMLLRLSACNTFIVFFTSSWHWLRGTNHSNTKSYRSLNMAGLLTMVPLHFLGSTALVRVGLLLVINGALLTMESRLGRDNDS